MRVVAVTGVSGYVGRCVAEALEERDDVRRVVGIDVVAPGFSGRAFEHYRMDVRSDALADVLSGCDAVVHLAFSRSGGDPAELRDANVGGARNVVTSAARAGVGRVVCCSSTLAYGAHPDNDVPLTEDAVLRPVRDLPASAHAAAIEEIVASESAVPATVLRLAPVAGPRVRGPMAGVVEAPAWLAVRGSGQLVQVVHEQDAADAILFAIDGALDGTFNVCADGWIPDRRAAEIVGRRRVELSEEQARRVLALAWRGRLSSIPPEYLPFLRYPVVASNERLRAAGFVPSRSVESSLAAAAAARRGWVSLGHVRFRPRNLTALAGAAAVGASIVARAARRATPDA